MSWLLALLCALLWGCGYTVLNKLTPDLNQYTINVVYGSCVVVINFLIVIFTEKIDNFLMLAENNNSWYLFLYNFIFILTNFVSIYGFETSAKEKNIQYICSHI